MASKVFKWSFWFVFCIMLTTSLVSLNIEEPYETIRRVLCILGLALLALTGDNLNEMENE